MADHTFPLEGSISRLDSEFLQAQKACNDALTRIARNQKSVYAQLLELVPQEIQGKLRTPLHRLIAYKSTVFQINAAGDERSAHSAALLSELIRGWQEAVEVDIEVKTSGIKTRFIVYLRAVPHTPV